MAILLSNKVDFIAKTDTNNSQNSIIRINNPILKSGRKFFFPGEKFELPFHQRKNIDGK